MKKILFLLTTVFCSPVFSGPLLTDDVFDPSSFWYTPIPTSAPLHPNSVNLVTELLRQKATYYGTVNINTSSYSAPVYYTTGTETVQKVTQWDCQKKGYLDAGLKTQWATVPIPDYAVQSAGTDGEMAVYDVATDTYYEFWQARKVNGAWQACWGGRITAASFNTGVFDSYYGTTATSLPFIGGQITAEELQRGEIKHAIGIALVDVANFDIFSWPANRSDGQNPTNVANRIPEGLRFRLDPTINVNALSMSAAGKVIAKAAQIYGFVVWDRAGALSIRAQNSASYTAQGLPNPYPVLFGGLPTYQVLNGLPFNKMQFLPMDYGRP